MAESGFSRLSKFYFNPAFSKYEHKDPSSPREPRSKSTSSKVTIVPIICKQLSDKEVKNFREWLTVRIICRVIQKNLLPVSEMVSDWIRSDNLLSCGDWKRRETVEANKARDGNFWTHIDTPARRRCIANSDQWIAWCSVDWTTRIQQKECP